MDVKFIHLPPGIIMRVFDSKLWNWKDVGDNSQFWKDAEIISVYTTEDGKLLADVRFLHDDRISTGHFVAGMKESSERR